MRIIKIYNDLSEIVEVYNDLSGFIAVLTERFVYSLSLVPSRNIQAKQSLFYNCECQFFGKIKSKEKKDEKNNNENAKQEKIIVTFPL